jgi:hypothetical protein
LRAHTKGTTSRRIFLREHKWEENFFPLCIEKPVSGPEADEKSATQKHFSSLQTIASLSFASSRGEKRRNENNQKLIQSFRLSSCYAREFTSPRPRATTGDFESEDIPGHGRQDGGGGER